MAQKACSRANLGSLNGPECLRVLTHLEWLKNGKTCLSAPHALTQAGMENEFESVNKECRLMGSRLALASVNIEDQRKPELQQGLPSHSIFQLVSSFESGHSREHVNAMNID
eukprot:TRINITY_DN8214_c0_g1_i1.p1 TRINITY_DN8214_c0_g1~~TRINITY_DN8214_c0_g1_i1.p1  ORF type:complete len:112 (+),score=4.15 TRINITY_DN8214_c0_g1_i1:195-530(+)